MPKKKLYLQISFEQGMIDSLVEDYDYQDSDLKWQSPQSRSALYIENYDPNIVRGALTKRYGYGLLRWQGSDITGDVGLYDKNNLATGFFAGYPPNFSQTHVNLVALDKFTTLIDIDPDPGGVAGFGFSGSDAITVCGAMAMPHNKPVAQALVLYFVRDIVDNTLSGGSIEERTRIVHYGKHLDQSVPNDAAWRNAHINTGNPTSGNIRGPLYPATYPGWEIRGTFTGAARHGGNLVVSSNAAYDYRPWATNPYGGTTFDWTQTWIQNMYPCYVWTYWDYRRKRNKRKFWQIIADGTNSVTILDDLSDNYDSDDKYSHFKVLYPSQKVTRDTDFVSWRAYTTTFVDPILGSQSFVVTNASVAASGDLTTQCRAIDNVSESFSSTVPVNSAIEVSIIEARTRQYATAAIQHVSDTIPGNDQLAVLSEYAYLNKYTNYIHTLEIPKNYDIVALTNDYWKIHRGDYGATATYDTISIIDGVITYSNIQRNTKIVGTSLIKPGPNGLDIKVGNGKTGDDFKEITDPVYWTVGISLPDYLASNAPRPWLKGEKLPLALTATIRGAEILLSRHVHTVQMDDYEPYPAMHYPSSTMSPAAFGLTNTNGQGGGTISVTPYVVDDKSFLEVIGSGPAAHRQSVTEQYYLLKDQQVRINGKLALVANVRGFALAEPTTNITPEGNIVRYRLYTSYKPYCIEPFNPTSNYPFVSKAGEHNFVTNERQRARIYSRPAARYPDTAVPDLSGVPYRDANTAGYRREHTNAKVVFVTIKIAKARFSDVFEQGIESLNLYCAQPSTESAFQSVGLYSVQEPQQGIYMLPEIPSQTELNQYRLVKRYILDGDGTPYHSFRNSNDKQYWKQFYTGNPTATNSWVEKGPDASTGFLVATGQHEDEDNTGSSASTELTPDFILWDYPVSTTLSLNSSGQYWQGRGAGLVTNIKGRTFIGQCIDQYGDEEQAILRYSDVQSGVITLDLFSEENFLKVGGLPHTALAEYREQLWVFNSSEVHRIQLPDVVNQTTWEYLDKIPGQGTYDQKTVITTPLGVIWANEGGVWISDGRMPENLAESVLTFYKMMATNAPPYYSTKITLPQFPYDEYGRNPYLEVSYDEFKDELVISSPSMVVGDEPNDFGGQPNQIPQEEYRLVYSFAAKTWHVQHADLPVFGAFLNEFDQNGKVTF
jgi:hypothetical protein